MQHKDTVTMVTCGLVDYGEIPGAKHDGDAAHRSQQRFAVRIWLATLVNTAARCINRD